MDRRESRSPLVGKTSATEWIAAAAGLILTLGVLGYALSEGLSGTDAPPDLSVTASTPARIAGGYLVPITVRNAATGTAASVRVSGRLDRQGAPPELRSAEFAYIPGKGAAEGGLVFEDDPRRGALKIRVEGFEAP